MTDPKGTAVSTYDGTDATGKTEHRGARTKLVVTRTGTNPATSPVLTYTASTTLGRPIRRPFAVAAARAPAARSRL